jgi:O-antigen ligase
MGRRSVLSSTAQAIELPRLTHVRLVAPGRWPLIIALILIVLGTARYVERDSFHNDESVVQPIIEISSVVIGAALAVGAFVFHGARLGLRFPSILLLLTLTLALAFSQRSWGPALSATRGTLLLLISFSTIALLRTYGLRPLLFYTLNAFVVLIGFGLIIGALAPDYFPLMVHDPGEEAVRVRLHLLRIHPIALADDCAICLLISVIFAGRWIRLCRFIFVACLLLTVTRTSILLGLPLYFVARRVYSPSIRTGLKPSRVIGVLVFVPALIAIALLFAYSDWWGIDEIRTSFSHVVDATKDNVTLNGRTALWSTLIADLSSENIYGYGVGGARYYLRTVNPWFGHSHNSLLETVYTSGYIGAALIIAALGAAAISCFRASALPEVRVLLVLIFYVIAAGMMNPSWYETSSLMAISIVCVGPSALKPLRSSGRTFA